MIQRIFFSIKAPPPQNETIFEKSVVLIVQALFRPYVRLFLFLPGWRNFEGILLKLCIFVANFYTHNKSNNFKPVA